MTGILEFGRRYGIWLALAIFLLALWGGASLFLDRHSHADLKQTQDADRSEFMIIESVVANELQRKNYQAIEPLLNEWGRNAPGTVDLRLVAENGFVIGQYTRAAPARHYHDLKATINYAYNKRADLSIRMDLGTVYGEKERVATELIVAAASITAIISYLLVISLRRRAEADILRMQKLELDHANEQLKDEILRRIKAEHILHSEKQLSEITLRSIGDAVITTDTAGNVTFLNPVAEQLTGWTLAQAENRPLDQVFNIVDETTRKPSINPVTRCLQEKHAVSIGNGTLLISCDGNEYVIEDSAAPIRHATGDIHGVVMVFRDVTERKQLAKEISHQARHDALTGLGNRIEFNQHLARLLASARADDREHALCYLDLDQFKVVNDTCGHIAGDTLLQQISVLLKQYARVDDTIARLGGDEFGILFENCPLAKAEEIAHLLCRKIGEVRFSWESKVFEIGVSIGLVPISAKSGGPTTVLSQADVACYTAKDLGRNRIHVYSAGDEELTRRENDLHWASRISGALEQNRFRLYVQKIACLGASSSTEHDHYEVLLRMLDDDGSEIMPGTFIPAAERYQLMPAVDRWVIHNALVHYSSLKTGDDVHAPSLSINLSGNSLNSGNLQGYIEEQFHLLGVPPQAICFEITETAAIHNLSRASELIRGLRAIGCRFALDDFGSGLSSFAYLKVLPVDYLKIDGRFVRDMVNDPIDFSMVTAINDIGHIMKIRTVAEFVENADILTLVREIGVDYAQGYAIAMPEPIAMHTTGSQTLANKP